MHKNKPISTLEHLYHSLDTRYQGVYFLTGVIKSERGTNSSENTQAVHQRLGTMMTSPDCNTKLIEECTEVHVVDIAYIKADNGIATIPSMPVDVHSFYLTQLLKGIMCEVLLMR